MQEIQKDQVVANLMQKDKQEKNYGGIRRLGYFFGMLGLAVIYFIFIAAWQGPDAQPIAPNFVLVVTLVLSFILVVNRLHNIGKSGWWSLFLLFPVLGLIPLAMSDQFLKIAVIFDMLHALSFLPSTYIITICFAFPTGYQDTKKLDTAGKIIAGIFISLVVLSMVASVVYFAKQ